MAVLQLILVLCGVFAVAGAASWMVTGSLTSDRASGREDGPHGG